MHFFGKFCHVKLLVAMVTTMATINRAAECLVLRLLLNPPYKLVLNSQKFCKGLKVVSRKIVMEVDLIEDNQ